MATLKAYIAKRKVNFEFLIGNHIDNIQFIIKDADGNVFDFTGNTGITIRIYDNRTKNRELVVTHTEATELSVDIPTGVITWDAVFPTAMTFGEYNYELDYSSATSEDIRLAEGTVIVV